MNNINTLQYNFKFMDIKLKLKHLLLMLFLLNMGILNAQQKIKVTGQIVDNNQEAIIGANVLIKGTTIGTITDFNGNFTLDANIGSVLNVTYLGYVPQEVTVTAQQPMVITLKENAQELNEVVVVGYGTQKKISTIGAQSGIKVVSELKQPVANLSTVLAGRVSGIVGLQQTGEPGNDAANIWVRGIATLGGTSPLILVDGVERSMDDLNPEDIESFSILKDASATAVYGVRGANGVIIITTKNGEIGKPRIRAEYTYGFTRFTKLPELADGITYMQCANEAATTRGKDPLFSAEKIGMTASGLDPYLYPNVDWYDQIFNDWGHNQRVSVNVNGGSENVQYYVSLSYYDEAGLFKVDNMQDYKSEIKYSRYNFNSSLNMKVTPTTNLKLNIKGNMADKNSPYVKSDDIFSAVFRIPAIQMPVIYPGDRVPFLSTGGGLMNPLAELTKKGYRSTTHSKVMADLSLEQKLDFITKGLSFKGMFAYDIETKTYLNRTRSYNTYWADSRDENGELIIVQQGNSVDEYLKLERGTDKNQRKYYMEAALNYNRTFADAHTVTGMLLFNRSDRSDLNSNSLTYSLPYRSQGLAGRATYSFKDRYMAEVNFGYNGSENFTPGKRYGFFPSFGAGWVASNEPWFEPVSDVISLLKIRASYGQVGSDQIKIGDTTYRFGFLSEMSSSSNVYQFGLPNNTYGVTGGKDVSKYAVNVGWEVSTKANLGLDLELFRGDLTLNFDVFKERREDIFIQRQSIPATAGINVVVTGNLGIVENKGFEVNADFNKRFGDFIWGVKGNLSYNKNKIIEDDTPSKPYPWMESRGTSVGQRLGYICDGFYTDDDINNPDVAKTVEPVMAGDLKYRDLNGDNVIDDYDKTYIGKGTVPNIVYGFGTTAEWKGFSLGAFFQGVGSCDIFMNGTDFVPFENATARGNLFSNITDRWTENNPRQDALYPRLAISGTNQNYATSDHWIKNGAFLRLKTLDFGYTIPKTITSKWHISNLRFYVLATNVFTISGFDMWDPELGNGTGTKYPNISTYSLGLSFQF